MSNQRNTGKPSEATFVENLKAGGVYVVRLRDAADLYGLNKKKVTVFGLPSDFICVSKDRMFFAEVKSSSNKTSFSFSCFQPAQKAAMMQCKIATDVTRYLIYIHNVVTDTWYIMTGNELVDHVKKGKKSIKWNELCTLTSWSI